MGSAISGIDQALWDLRGKILGMPVYRLLAARLIRAGCLALPRRRPHRGRNSCVCADRRKSGHHVLQDRPGRATFEWLDTHQKIDAVVSTWPCSGKAWADIDIAIDFHAKPSPTVASVIIKEIEPLNLLFVEEPCPPENVKAMAAHHPPDFGAHRYRRAPGGVVRLRELIEMGVVDVIQVDINHVGGITALWKVAAMAHVSGITMAPHACEGPIGGVATLHVDAAMPNFLVQEICSARSPARRRRSGRSGWAFRPCAWSTAGSRCPKSPASVRPRRRGHQEAPVHGFASDGAVVPR